MTITQSWTRWILAAAFAASSCDATSETTPETDTQKTPSAAPTGSNAPTTTQMPADTGNDPPVPDTTDGALDAGRSAPEAGRALDAA